MVRAREPSQTNKQANKQTNKCQTIGPIDEVAPAIVSRHLAIKPWVSMFSTCGPGYVGGMAEA
jgi:hypothetical protein